MSVYKKLQQARAELCAKSLKKTGFNKFAGYQYFELADFLPEIQEIFSRVGLCGITDFSSDTRAALHVHDTDSDSSVSFYSPLADATVKGATAIQIVGSQITYLRRYLWMQALEITDNDSVDSQPPSDSKPTQKPPQTIDYSVGLKSAKNLQELGESWKLIPKDQQKTFFELKEKRKQQLTLAVEKPKADTDWQQLLSDATTKEEVTAIWESMPEEIRQDIQDAYAIKLDMFR
jgi:ERF superfamily